jgi:phytoene dehydrogenase-like protein
MPHVLRTLFAATGAPLERVLDLVPVDPIARYRFADGTWLDASATSPAPAASTRRSAPARARTGARLHRAGRRIWEAVERPFLSSPLDGPRTCCGRPCGRPAHDRPVATLRGLGRRYLRDPRLRMLLDRYATYTGSDPRRAPAALATIPYAEQAFGAWYVRAGCAARPRRCRAGAERGARAHRRRRRRSVLGTGPAWGAAGRRRAAAADVVVANADAATCTATCCGRPARGGGAGAAPGRATPSLSGFVLLLGVRGRTPDSPTTPCCSPPTTTPSSTRCSGPTPGPCPTRRCTSPPPTTRGAPDGARGLVRARQRPPPARVTGPSTGTPRPRLAEPTPTGSSTCWPRAASTCATGSSCDGRSSHPADLERAPARSGGAIYGTSSNGPRAAFLRPANRSPRSPGCTSSGARPTPGGGLPLVRCRPRSSPTSSARPEAPDIPQDHGTRGPWRRERRWRRPPSSLATPSGRRYERGALTRPSAPIRPPAMPGGRGRPGQLTPAVPSRSGTGR